MALPSYDSVDEIAAMVGYLASPEAVFVTGASLTIDGGSQRNGSTWRSYHVRPRSNDQERHSSRLFLPRSVPRELVEEALALAVYAPSNSNIQPWHMVFASGAPRDRLVAALLEDTQRGPPNIPPLPESFRHFRSELGAQVYGAMGIAREDKASHDAAVFRAPLAGIVCMHRDLGPPDALSVGMFLQTLLLALTARGLGTCVEVSVAGYPETVRAQLAIPAELSILCGLAVGYPDPDFPANRLHIGREAIGKNVVFVDT
jgi:nitroreductase